MSKASIMAMAATMLCVLPNTGLAQMSEEEVDPRPSPTFVLGAGSLRCDSFFHANRREIESYIFGYWSGLNMRNSENHLVGSTAGDGAIVAAVRAACEQEPDRLVTGAINGVYTDMAYQER
jgi:hypothetical protein